LMSKHTDLCGCEWEINGDIWTCTKRCDKHSKPPKKRPFRPKAECVRAGGRWD